MQRQIRDRHNRLLGWTEYQPVTGFTTAFKCGKGTVGWFNPGAGPDGATYMTNGQRIGTGNQLSVLIAD